MIDLHTHTKYSDGTDTVIEILTKASQLNLEVLSITDHNTCEAYKEMESLDINKLYGGKIICGSEFTAFFEDRFIEVLGYGFNIEKVNDFFNKYYSPDKLNKVVDILYNRLLNKIDEIGLTFHKENIKQDFFRDFFERSFYDELIKYEENKTILKEDVWVSFSNFFRKGLANKESKLFINEIEFKPNIKEVIDIIHSSGGIAFLAHPYQYKFSDIEDFLERIFNQNELDGVECFYTLFSKEQTDYLKEFANKRHILISGGSDYHGKNKQGHELGLGRGNLNIDKNITSNWNIKLYKESNE